MSGDTLNQPTGVASASDAAVHGETAALLHVVHPRNLRTTFALGGQRVVLGRQPEGDGITPFPNHLVSRKHFALEWDADTRAHFGVDLGSQNGSAVDGIEPQDRVRLRHGSLIRTGAALAVYESLPHAFAPEVTPVSLDAIPGCAAATRRLRAQIAIVAPDPSAVLITGDTGTGKEFVAAEIHRLSGRTGKLVPVNCAALSPQLVESELFGHVRGAFSGAQAEHAGLFRAAEGGTLFLDEIGDLPLALQPKLLRALQEKQVRPVGGSRDLTLDVRVIAATHRDLARMVDDGDFRQDLLARLSLWQLEVPSLCERRPDILMWLERMHRNWRSERRLPPAELPELKSLTAQSLLLLAWPENLRGVQRLAHELGSTPDSSQLRPRDLPRWLFQDAPAVATGLHAAPHDAAQSPPKPARQRLPIPSREELTAVFHDHGGSVRATAQHFQRDRRQVYRWLSAFGLRGKP